MKIYKPIILPVFLHGCETWSLTLREQYGLKVFENSVLRRIPGQKKNEVTKEVGENCIIRSFVTCTLRQI
jgi:hypothetical protein